MLAEKSADAFLSIYVGETPAKHLIVFQGGKRSTDYPSSLPSPSPSPRFRLRRKGSPVTTGKRFHFSCRISGPIACPFSSQSNAIIPSNIAIPCLSLSLSLFLSPYFKGTPLNLTTSKLDSWRFRR